MVKYIIVEQKRYSELWGEYICYGAVAKNIIIRYFMPTTWSNSRGHCEKLKNFMESKK